MLDISQMATTNLEMITIIIIAMLMLMRIIPADGQIHNPSYPGVIKVGGDSGWAYGIDHQAIINTYTLYVGDKLLFEYPVGKHDVVEVHPGDGFGNCTVPPGAIRHTSGKDVIDIDKEGHRWFFCSFNNGEHCRDGKMKFSYFFADNRPPAVDSSANSESSTGLQGGRKLGEGKQQGMEN